MRRAEGSFRTFDAEKLFHVHWMPDSRPWAVVIAAHGAFSHGETFEELAVSLADRGVALFAYDQRGWGHWQKTPGHVDSFGEYIADLMVFRDFVAGDVPGVPQVLLGHSFGGLVALVALVQHPTLFDRAILSSPWLGRKRTKVPLGLIMQCLSVLLPRLRIKAPVAAESMAKDPEVVARYKKEIESGIRKLEITPRWIKECEKAQVGVLKHCGRVTVPLLLLTAREDAMVETKLHQQLFDNIGSEDKHWEISQEHGHRTWAQPGKILTWLENQLG